MKGRVVEKLARALDGVANAAGRGNPGGLPAHLVTGRRGEDDAYFYLRRQGYVMVARNWRSPRHRGELDLIGWDGEVLCFIEVKTRTTRDVKPAEAAVDDEKRHDLCAAARDYLRRVSAPPAVRFDIVSVYYNDTEVTSPDITLFKNCFNLP
jgi:putative endonuclease